MQEKDTHNHPLSNNNLPDYLRSNPFIVPDRFFENQEAQLISLTAIDSLQKLTSTVRHVPEKYFEQMENDIFAKIAEQKLRNQVNESGLSVPKGYFENLASHVQSRIFETDLKQSQPEATAGFHAPDGYFDEARDRIQSIVKIDTLNLQDSPIFDIPENYFDSLSALIKDKIAQENTAIVTEETKEISVIPIKKEWTTWRRYASAAAVACFIGIGSYIALTGNTQTSEENYPNQSSSLQEISNDELVSYLAQETEGEDLIELATYLPGGSLDQSFEVDTQVEDKEIEEYLKYML